jgi:glycosyltransferase involved in cell wall biosynthesis
MLVTHLSTSDKSGGAAIAAWRLHQGLLGRSVESRVVSRHRSSAGPDVACVGSDLFDAADLFRRRRIGPAQPPGATLFSFASTTIPLLDHPWIAAADIVHLHWVANFVSPQDVGRLCDAGKTVFWTLHDQQPYTGGCHYIGGDRRLEQDWDGTSQIDPSLHDLARIELRDKRRILFNSPVHVISPSRWMASEAAASGVFSPERIHHIPYGFDLSLYSPAAASDSVSSPPADGEITFVFGCQNLSDLRKGYREFRDAIILCMEDPRFSAAAGQGRIRLKTFGTPPVDEGAFPIPVTHLGLLQEEAEIADLLRHSSAFICTTLDDNLPNVVMEAFACGIPVLGFATGGVPDMVTHGHTGLLSPRGDLPALARHLLDFCLGETLRQHLRQGVSAIDLNLWSLDTQARRMMELYQSVNPVSPLPSVVPDVPPVLRLPAKLLPHLAEEITATLATEHVSLQALLAERSRTSRETLDLYKVRLNNEITAREELKFQLNATNARSEDLKTRLSERTLQKNSLHTKLVDSRATVDTLRQKLAAETLRKQSVQAKLADSQATIKALRQQLIAKRTLFERIRRAIRSRIRKK